MPPSVMVSGKVIGIVVLDQGIGRDNLTLAVMPEDLCLVRCVIEVLEHDFFRSAMAAWMWSTVRLMPSLPDIVRWFTYSSRWCSSV